MNIKILGTLSSIANELSSSGNDAIIKIKYNGNIIDNMKKLSQYLNDEITLSIIPGNDLNTPKTPEETNQIVAGCLVKVMEGIHIGSIGHVIYTSDGTVIIKRLDEDVAKGLIPVFAILNISEVMRIYTDSELRYSAISRCKCGAGLAYPKVPINIGGCWDCSDILTGRATLGEDRKVHSDQCPFTFYDIKSEDQPSAYGATTRPKNDPKE